MSQASTLQMLATEYESDFRCLIYRTTSGEFEQLLDSFYLLTDLYCLIQRLEPLDHTQVDVPPPSAINNQQVLERLNIELPERLRLSDFLSYVERSKGHKFDELMDTHLQDANARMKIDQQGHRERNN